MLHHIYTQQWILLIVGIIFLMISIYTLFRGVKRDKIIAFSILAFCFIFYIFGELKIRSHNSKADNYFGIHQLKKYNNSSDYTLEVLPKNQFVIYNSLDTVLHGNWELNISEDKSTRLLLDGSIFGVGLYEIQK